MEQHFKTSGISSLPGMRELDQSASVLSHAEVKGKQKKRSRADPRGADGGNQTEAGQAQEEIGLVQDAKNAKNLALKFM